MIVCTFQSDIYVQGLAAAFTSIYGEKFKLWQPEVKPVYDMLDELNPDLLLTHQQYWDVVQEPLKEFKTKPYLIQPNFELANIVHYSKGTQVEELSSDVLYWSRGPVTKEFIQFLWQIAHIFKLKIFGPVRIDMPHYLGQLDFKDTADALASAKLNLDFNNFSRFDAAINNTFSFLWSPEVTIKDIQKTFKNKTKALSETVWNEYTFHHEVFSILQQMQMDIKGILEDLKKYR